MTYSMTHSFTHSFCIHSVLSDSSEDSVGAPTRRVILFGTIPTTIPDTTPVIALPITQTDITGIPTKTPIIAPTIPPSPDYTPASPDYSPVSETEFDPSEDPPSGHIPPLPGVSPFLSSDDDTTYSDTPDTSPSPTNDTLFTEITASTQRSPVIPRRRVMILASGQPIPHGPSRKRRRSPMTSVPALPPVSGALSHVHADLIPSPKRARDIGYLADVEVGPRETRVERITYLAMPKDIPEPAQEGAAEVLYETLGDLVQRFHDHTQAISVHRIQVIDGVQREQGHRIVGVESAVTALTERVAKLERDNRRLRGTASVESQRVDRLQRAMSRIAAESTLMDEHPFAPVDNDPFISIFASEPTSEASSSGDACLAKSTYITQTLYTHKITNILVDTLEMRLKSRVQNPLVDATSASPMVLLAKSSISARHGPSLEKVNNPCWSFARDLVGGSPCTWTFTAASSVYDRGSTAARGSFPSSVYLGQSPSMPFHPSQLFASGSQGSSQATLLSNAFNTITLHDILNMCIYASISVGDRHFILDFITRRVLLRCDSTGDLYPITTPSTIPHAFLTHQYTCHQRIGHPESEVLCHLVYSDSISCNKEKLPVLCHDCQLDNKRPRAMALKAELRNIKLGDLSIDGISARRGPSLEKVNNPCWSFARDLVGLVMLVSIFTMVFTGSLLWSLVPLVQLLVWRMGVQYGNGWVIPTEGSVSDGVTPAGGLLSTAGFQTLSGPPHGGSPCTWTFTTASLVYDRGSTAARGSFPGSVYLGQSPSMPFHLSQLFASGSQGSSQATLLSNAFNTITLQYPTSGNWNIDTVGDRHFILVSNSVHSVLSTPFWPLRLNNVLITPNIVKNLIYVRHFVCDNSCTVEFDPFGFFVKDFITRRVLLRCDSTGDLYPITKPSTIPHAFLTRQYTWHQRIGHPESEVLCHLVSSDSISCNKEKLLVLCHDCQLGKHMKLPFVSSSSSVTLCFDIVHSDL
nr:ribonuclease H-like domain-containing protein [Tanacetum cinerariifolium]